MKQKERAALKKYAGEQLEMRIQAILLSIREQTGLRVLRRDIIGVLDAQYERVILAFRVGLEPTTLSEGEFIARMSVMDEVIAELKMVPEAV